MVFAGAFVPRAGNPVTAKRDGMPRFRNIGKARRPANVTVFEQRLNLLHRAVRVGGPVPLRALDRLLDPVMRISKEPARLVEREPRRLP